MRRDYGIRRMQAESGAEYWHVGCSRKRVRHEKSFYFLKHGGCEPAYLAAIAWRDARLRELAPLTVLQFAEIRRTNNSSGVPGVSFLTPRRQPAGIWQARLKVGDARPKVKSFSVLRLGHEEAFRQAVAARRTMLAATHDRPFLHEPMAVKVALEQEVARRRAAFKRKRTHPAR